MNSIRFNIIFTISILLVLNCTEKESAAVNYKPYQSVDYTLSGQDEAFLDTLQFYTLQYFLEEINPELGLVKDRSSATSPASIAAMGFAVPAWVIGVERGWMERDQAVQYTLNMLNFLMTSSQSEDELATGYKGFYYHFLDMEKGQRQWKCELSTVDTAWLIAGLRFAAQYFDRGDDNEALLRKLVDDLTLRIDWDWFTLSEQSEYPFTLSMGWHPEKGFNSHGWRGFNEALYIYALAAGSGMTKAKEGYQTWLSYYRWDEPYPGMAHALFEPLFGHQYSHLFIDFRGIADNYMRTKNIDYFENARRATLTQRLYGRDNPMKWTGYDSLTWGWTACDGPGREFNFDDRTFRTYSARGNAGPDHIEYDDGTIAPTAAGGSLPFAPQETLAALKHMKQMYGKKGLWGKYGFLDSFNPTLNWYNKDYLGIDQGPIIIMAENLRSGLIWKYSMKDPLLHKGLEIIGFQSL
ncbi:MAG: Tat pathway signal protein [Calditrichae bacterium]|nr:Tat pathway signal protein [Calditrichia bacterium]